MAIEIESYEDRAKPPANANREEKPRNTKIQDFLSEMVEILRDKLNAQNSKIEKIRADVSVIKQSDLESIKRSMKELERKIDLLDKKIDLQRADVDPKILDNLRKA
jgi:polyhydroxyalkanoate synthesis regulator phasin